MPTRTTIGRSPSGSARARGLDGQPLSSVEWVLAEELTSNTYNPNHVAPPELRLLKVSLLADGWTQPIVANLENEIIDGFHRWTLALKDSEVIDLTGGYVPVVRLDRPLHERMASTVRHNRARGKHGVDPMARIVRVLHDEYDLTDDEIGDVMGMEREEVERLLDRGQMTKRAAGDEFAKGWVPK